MKYFLIQRPRHGKTTCSLYGQYYDKSSGKTKKDYLGSFNLKICPEELPKGMKLRPGVTLKEAELDTVRTFLRRHGTYGQLPPLPTEVMSTLREQVREELEREMRAQHPDEPDAAVIALEAAAEFVSREVARLRRSGARLSPGMLGSMTVEPKEGATELDLLKVKSNRVRASFQRFEAALKAAALMKSITRSTSRKAAG